MKAETPLFLDTQRFTQSQVTLDPEPKTDNKGEQSTDRNTGQPIWQTQVFVLGPSGGAVLLVRTAGDKPSVKAGQSVVFEDLEAVPWANGDRNGIAYRAIGVKAATASTSKAA